MSSVCFYFQVHQPFRLRHYTVFDKSPSYFDEFKNAAICRKVANKCYLPTNRLLLELIQRYEGRFRVAFSTDDGQNDLASGDLYRLYRTTITPRTTPALFRLRLLRLVSYLDKWRHRSQRLRA